MKTELTELEKKSLKEIYDIVGISADHHEFLNQVEGEIRVEMLDAIESIEMVHWMAQPSNVRGYAKDRERDDEGRIVVDIAKPHILEDMDYFRQPAIHFQKYGKYTNLYPNPHPKSEYRKFWDEETRRCIHGLVRPEDGEWIPGYYYFYLNYFPIMRTKATGEGTRAERVYDFVDVWDSDYLFFHYIEQGEQSSQYGAVLKTRGRGYSFKNASMLVRNYYFFKKSKGFAFASENEYLIKDGILNKAWDGLEFIDANTPWTKLRQKKDTMEHKRASYIDAEGNEKGYKSEIIAVTTKGNPEKGRGKRGKLLIHEEGGIYPGLLQTWNIARPSIEDGDFTFGYQIVFGTGGCLTAKNKVFTKDGNLVNIEDLKMSDGIIGFNSKTNSYSKEPISYWQRPVVKNCVMFITNTRRTIECSLDHPIYTTVPTRDSRKNKYYFKNAEDFKVGDYVAVIDEVPLFGKKRMWNPRLVGLLIGDGSYRYNAGVTLSNCDKEILDYIKANFKTNVKEEYLTKTGKTYQELSILGIRPELKKLGILNQTKKDKTLPKNVHLYSKEDLQELIAGFYDADGYVNIRKNKIRDRWIAEISLSSCSEELLNEVRFVLQKFGIHGRIRERLPRLNKKGPIKDKNPWFEFTIADKRSLIKFAENFKLLTNHKQKRLDKIKLEFSKINHHSVDSGVRLEKIVSILYTGPQEVFNLTADSTNTYIGNGIITHNTVGSKFEGLEELFYRGGGYKVLTLRNVWDKVKGEGYCGYFVPEYMNRKGCYDENGNSDVLKALYQILVGRKKIRENASKENALTQEKAERPVTPQESIMRIEGSLFPIDELKGYLESIMPTLSQFTANHYIGRIQPDANGILSFSPSADAKVIREFPLKDNINKHGAIEIFEMPQRDGMGNIPRFRYYAGIDPIDDDSSTTNSLASIFIADILTDRIVAEYTGRPRTANDFYEICLRLLKFYNAVANYEADKKGLFAYFSHRNALSYIADTPQILKDMELVKATNLYGNKAHPYSEKIYTPNGIKTWGEIKIGDKIFNSYGGVSNVIDIPFDDITDIYEITLKDGRKVKASGNHLWKVIDSNGYEKILTTEYLKDNLLRSKGKYNECNFYIPKNEGVEYIEKEVEIDPYLLGLFLGDGCMTQSRHHQFYFTSNIPDLENYKKNIPYEIKTLDDRHHRILIKNIGKKLRNLGLQETKSRTKFIPDIYKFNSKNVRLNLLQGLLDTDGHIGYGGNPEYCTISEQLALDVVEVARSLGINCNLNVNQNKFGKVYKVRFYTDIKLFKLIRKANKQKITKTRAFKTGIVDIKYVGKEQAKCITVDSKDNCYLISDYITTHNSKGTHSGPKINAWGRRLQADWMLEPAYGEEKTGLMNLHKIRSIGYLKEAIAWNEDINADRVSAMGMLMILREEYKKYKLQVQDSLKGANIKALSVDPFFDVNFKLKGQVSKQMKAVIREKSYNDLKNYDA